MSSFVLSEALESASAQLLERHLSRAKEWFPHELVPWSLGRDCAPGEQDEATNADQRNGICPDKLAPGVASALYVNLLTEDNLPHYYHAIAEIFGFDSPMGEWSRRWTAEEQRHAIVIRDWICVTRQLDLVALERARMHQVSTGFRAGVRAQSVSDGLVYLALQELATRISHWNTGQLLDGTGAAVMKRVAADENLHFLFYRDMATAALQADPSAVVVAIDRQVTEFQMPGTGIDGFAAHAAAIAAAGIYDYRVHYEQILLPVVLTHWRLETLDGLSDEAERARDHVMARIARMKRVADRLDAQSARSYKAASAESYKAASAESYNAASAESFDEASVESDTEALSEGQNA